MINHLNSLKIPVKWSRSIVRVSEVRKTRREGENAQKKEINK